MIRVRINDRTWRVRHVLSTDLAKGCDGECDHPPGRFPEIRVRRSLKGQRRLETEVHEVLHASRPELDEEAVSRTAAEVSSALWKIGWRFPA